MVDDKVDIEDLEAFIDGLKTSLDSLGDIDPQQSKGFQAQLAKAISDLRSKRKAKIEPLPKRIRNLTNEDLKIFLLKELESLQHYLDNSDYNRRDKFKVVMKLTRIREQVNSM